jgi:hypothetical protein
MASPEGYVFHTYGPLHYLRYVVASLTTLRRHDLTRSAALYCPPEHRAELQQHRLDWMFDVIEDLPEEHRSIVGFKHHLHRFMPFERSLFVDSDMVWCRNPDPLWTQLSTYNFTATGLDRSDAFFGAPKGFGVLWHILTDQRRRTINRFGLTHLPRIQAGMIYAADAALTQKVCETATSFLHRRPETHFRSRLDEGRSEESCEWSLAMALSRHDLPVLPWFQGRNSPQLDFIDSLTDYSPGFQSVTVRYYCDPFVYSLRGIANEDLRAAMIGLFSRLPGRGDHIDVTPFVIHFGWLHQKTPYKEFAAAVWNQLIRKNASLAGNNG